MKFYEAQLRLATGIILALYVVQHLVNHAFGIVSIELAEGYRQTIGAVFQSLPGLALLYTSLTFHVVIALRSIYRRSSLRLSTWQWGQILMGLSILPLVVGHAIGNRGYDLLGNTDPNYYLVITLLSLKPEILLKLLLLVLVVWIHMIIGLHFWLRIRRGYAATVPYGYALVILLPALAYTGIFSMMREASNWLDDDARLEQIFAANSAMKQSDIDFLQGLETQAWITMAILLALTLLARHVRIWYRARNGSFQVTHSGGQRFTEFQGVSLLEALRNAGIPHASVCGGRARCTTCRVHIGNGLDQLHPPNELEARALERIKAPDNVRLACQLHPTADLSITPLILPGQPQTKTRGGGVQGHEEYVVAMFVDMRGSTNLGERVLAYDVVFILNRFFTELSSALDASHGHYAQFAGDGLMALYGLDPARKGNACRDALHGAREMFRRIDGLNEQLQREFGETVQMGIGIHGGEAIVGTMGPPTTPLLTAVGDNINIAARLEAQTKVQGCDLIISVETLERELIDFPEATIREVEIRGRKNHVQVLTFDSNQLPAPHSG